MKCAKKFKLSEIDVILGALRQLDGYDAVVRDAQGNDSTVRCQYKLGLLRLPIIQNTRNLSPPWQEFNDARSALIKELSGGKDTLQLNAVAEPVVFTKFTETIKGWLNAEHEVTIFTMLVANLDLDINQIPIAAIATLMDHGIVVDEDESKSDTPA